MIRQYDDDIYLALEKHNMTKNCYCGECEELRRLQSFRYGNYNGVSGSHPPEQVFVADCYGNERVKSPVEFWKNAYWKCPYCGILQLKHLVTCSKCGAPREE